jgi:DNA invertase Pin-like site-specific DNA recombinase
VSRVAIGIVRVSRRGERAGARFVSPVEQRGKIEEACKRDGLRLAAVHEEIDVSGGTPLERREGLRAAVEAIEAGEAEILMVAYFDRLVRSLKIQEEVVSRVEAAKGRVIALDIGEVSGATATQWVSSTVIGMVAEYYRRSVSERVRATQAEKVAGGVMPSPVVPPGYLRAEDGVLEPDPELAPVVLRAFELRAEGATIREVREHLRANGIDRAYSVVKDLLANRIYLGEVNFGKLSNLGAHEPIVSPALFDAVQRARAPRGRRAKSERLLARLGVLRCGTCGGPMAVTHTTDGRANYRCNPISDCPQHMAISARVVEPVVWEATKERWRDLVGRASLDEDASEAEQAAEASQADFEAAIRAFARFSEEPAARERLDELRRIRDADREHADHLRDRHSALSVTVEDLDLMSVPERRRLIRATVAAALVMPGRGADRIRLELLP